MLPYCQVFITLKEGAFKPLSLKRHIAEVYSILESLKVNAMTRRYYLSVDKKALLICTDKKALLICRQEGTTYL